MRFCANISFLFTEYKFLERYAHAKKCGFTAVESGFPFGLSITDVVAAKEKAGLDQILINLQTGDVTKGELGIATVKGKENEFLDSLKTTIDYAKALQCPKIHIMSGIVENRTPEMDQVFENNLLAAESLLRRENIIGVIEPINNYTVPNYYLNCYKKALQFVQKVNSAHIRLMVDVFHMQQIQGDVTRGLRTLLPYVGHVQIAQVPDRHEPDSEGELNYRYLLKQLEQMGYCDWIGLEYKASAAGQGLSWIQNFGYTL